MIVRFMMVSFTDVEFSPTEIPILRGYFFASLSRYTPVSHPLTRQYPKL